MDVALLNAFAKKVHVIKGTPKSSADLTLRVFESILIVGIGALIFTFVNPTFGLFATPADRDQWMHLLWFIPAASALAIVGLRRQSIPILIALLLLLAAIAVAGGFYFMSILPTIAASALNWWIGAIVIAALSIAGWIVVVAGVINALTMRRSRFWRHARESSPFGRTGVGHALNILGLPTLARSGAMRKGLGIILLMLSATSVGLGIRQAAQLLPEFGANLSAANFLCGLSSASDSAITNDEYWCSWSQGQYRLLFMGFSTLVLLFGLLFLARRLDASAWTLLRLDAERQAKKDKRSSVLFLRPFGAPNEDDRVVLEDDHVLSARGKSNIDQIVTEEFTGLGPTIALAKPGQLQALSGAARLSCPHELWQETVTSLSNAALCTVLCLGDTPGVGWELDHQLATDRRGSTLFLAHPTRRGQEHNRLLMRALAGIGIPELEQWNWYDVLPTVVAAYQLDGEPMLLLSKQRSAAAYQLAIRHYARALWRSRLRR